MFSSKTGHEFVKLRVQFHAFIPANKKQPEFTRTTPLMVINTEVYPGVIADFAGKWNPDFIYHCRAQKDGQKVFLHILKSYAAPLTSWDAPNPPAVTPPAAAAPATPATPPAAAATVPICPECGQQATRFDNKWVHCGREVGS